MAEVALHRNFNIIIELHGPKWAGLHTCYTTNTQIFVYKHYALIVPINSFYGTCIPARRSRAVVTIDGNIKRGFLNHPNQPWSDTEAMFLLSCNLAGVASHTILLRDIQKIFAI